MLYRLRWLLPIQLALAALVQPQQDASVRQPPCSAAGGKGDFPSLTAALPSARPGSSGRVRLWNVFLSPREAPCYGSERAEAAGPHPAVGDGAGRGGGQPSPETLSDRLQEQLHSVENIELQSASSFTRCFPYRQRYSQYRNA